MFSQRWSTFTVLLLMTVLAVVAFCSGRHAGADHSLPPVIAVPTPVPQVPPTISSQLATVTNSVALTQVANPGQTWEELSAQPRTPAGEAELAALIEKLAEQDPQRALALATAQTNLRLRAALLRAALKGWGKTQPEAAVEWARTQTVMDSAQAISALLQGTVQDPDKAVSVTSALIQNDASRADEFGGDLISALTEAGQFERAATFAATGPVNCREGWLLPAYSRWAEFQPQAAMANAMQITDAGVREEAMNAIVVGWSPSDPKGMLEYAQNHLSAGLQSTALQNAIGFLADSDPAAAATWINQNDPGPQSDNGISEIALSSQLTHQPELAVTWAESILNPELCLETLTTVIEKWTAMDQAGAENYIKNSPVLTPEDRIKLLDQSQMLAELKK